MQLAAYGGIGVGLTWGTVIAQRSWHRVATIAACIAGTGLVIATVDWCGGTAAMVSCTVATISAFTFRKVLHG